jgi:hypothetical protein
MWCYLCSCLHRRRGIIWPMKQLAICEAGLRSVWLIQRYIHFETLRLETAEPDGPVFTAHTMLKFGSPITSATQTRSPVNGENKIWRINWIIDFTVWCMYYINVLQTSKNLIIRSFMSQTESLSHHSFQFILQLTEKIICNVIVIDLWGTRFETQLTGSSDWDFPSLYLSTRERMTSIRNLFVSGFIHSILKLFP